MKTEAQRRKEGGMEGTQDLWASGEVREVGLEGGTIRYRDEGDGPVLVFVHGILVNGALWRDVVARLSGRYRCVVPDLPLGGHSVPMSEGADLTPRGVARLVAEFMEALDLRDVTLVGNDTGGAICQVVISHHPERIGRLILTNCDAYEAFFPLPLSPFHHGPRLFGERFVGLVAWLLQARPAQRALTWTVSRRRAEPSTLDAHFGPLTRSAGVRRDLTKFLRSVSNRYTLEAARSFPQFRRPVLIAWGENDPFFSMNLARRLQRDFSDARLERIPGSRAFVPEDQPERLAGLVAEFAGRPDATGPDNLGTGADVAP